VAFSLLMHARQTKSYHRVIDRFPAPQR
jgi:hypothetical protein